MTTKFFYFILFFLFSASGCPLANKHKLQRHLVSGAGGDQSSNDSMIMAGRPIKMDGIV